MPDVTVKLTPQTPGDSAAKCQLPLDIIIIFVPNLTHPGDIEHGYASFIPSCIHDPFPSQFLNLLVAPPTQTKVDF